MMQLAALESDLPNPTDSSTRIALAPIQVTRSMQKEVELGHRESMQILVAESTIMTRILISTLLQREGYHVHPASSAEEVRQIVRQHGLPDLAILGVHLADCEGGVLASELRQSADIPVLYVASTGENNLQGQLAHKQADDYLAKPFLAADLLSRVRHRLSIEVMTYPNVEIAIDEHFQINLTQQYARLYGQRIELTPIETRLLDALYQHRGRVLSPGFLINRAWDRHLEGTLRSLWVHIRRLRSKIEPDPQHPRYIMTVRGQGYCLPRRPELELIIQ